MYLFYKKKIPKPGIVSSTTSFHFYLQTESMKTKLDIKTKNLNTEEK